MISEIRSITKNTYDCGFLKTTKAGVERCGLCRWNVSHVRIRKIDEKDQWWINSGNISPKKILKNDPLSRISCSTAEIVLISTFHPGEQGSSISDRKGRLETGAPYVHDNEFFRRDQKLCYLRRFSSNDEFQGI